MITSTKRDSEPVVQLGKAEVLHMVGYNVDAIPGDVMLPISVAMQVLFKVFEKWEIRKAQQTAVLGISLSTLARYRKGTFPRKTNTINRVEDLLRIELMLRVLFGQESQPNWIINKNTYFSDLSPIEYMSKNGTEEVRQYLENAVYAGGW